MAPLHSSVPSFKTCLKQRANLLHLVETPARSSAKHLLRALAGQNTHKPSYLLIRYGLAAQSIPGFPGAQPLGYPPVAFQVVWWLAASLVELSDVHG